jgi:hypothetical protein
MSVLGRTGRRRARAPRRLTLEIGRGELRIAPDSAADGAALNR